MKNDGRECTITKTTGLASPKGVCAYIIWEIKEDGFVSIGDNWVTSKGTMQGVSGGNILAKNATVWWFIDELNS
jgi:hypothetical protein